MKYRAYVGIDNGVSGSIGIVTSNTMFFASTPTKNHLKYTKKKSYINRINVDQLKNYLSYPNTKVAMVCIERPMVNPKRFQASASALRALEATLIAVEDLNLPYEFIDSKEWQKELLPSGIKGSANLKEASLQVGKRLFPMFEEEIDKQKDADGLLIAEYCRRKYGLS